MRRAGLLQRLRALGPVDRDLPVWYDPEYRLPLSGFGTRTGLDARRADVVAWYLLEARWIRRKNLRTPARARYDDIARVHGAEYLESLSRQETLAQIFGVDPWDVPVEELMRSVRLACGGTLAAVREAVARGGPAVNLAGGFHHAGPSYGAGLCPINDLAIAVVALRHQGFGGQVAVLDLDAHPPDGTAACLGEDPRVWIGSLSGSSPVVVPRVDETILADRCPDDDYVAALEALLARMPRPDLAFVVAGGDVLDGDHLGRIGLTLDGARRRDLAVARALDGLPAVWLPGGGYHPDAWKVLAGTVLAVMHGTRRPIQTPEDPLAVRFTRLSRHLGAQLPPPPELTFEDVEVELGMRPAGPLLLLGTYSPEALEYVLYRFGVLRFLDRRGYGHFRVVLGTASSGGERVSVFGSAGGAEHLLIDAVLERQTIAERDVLYVHWLTLRDPRARFSDRRPRLPGQEVPGLGLAREVTELLVLVARRLQLAGIGFRPAWFHTAYVARLRFAFVDPGRQGRFEALLRDLGGVPVPLLSTWLAEGRVRMNGEPYEWEPAEMVALFDAGARDAAAIAEERDRVTFDVTEGPPVLDDEQGEER
jgi:acetoin utilization deacetylase AcuC-like enzyme